VSSCPIAGRHSAPAKQRRQDGFAGGLPGSYL